MQPEDYLEFLGPEVIRLKGHRIGIEHVVELHRAGQSPEQIRRSFPTLSCEEIDAAIAYYLRHRAEVDAYLARQETIVEQALREYDARDPAPVVRRLRELKARREQEQLQHRPTLPRA
jgi:uncharacterized protein (DUF433 family)